MTNGLFTAIHQPIPRLAGVPTPKARLDAIEFGRKKQEMQAETKAFFAEGGAWEQLTTSAEALRKTVSAIYNSNEITTTPHRNDLGDKYQSYLFGDLGTYGELSNPLATEAAFNFAPNAVFATAPFSSRLKSFCAGFEQPSELSKSTIADRTNALLIEHDADGGIKVNPEPKRVALFRGANEVEKWLAHNASSIPEQDMKETQNNLKSYRDALAQVLGFVNKANEYLVEQEAVETTAPALNRR